jgi:hypothetical protein
LKNTVSFTFALDNSESVEYGEMIKGIESYLSTNGDFFEKLDGVVPYSFDAELNNQKEPKNIQQLESMLERFENKPGSGYERITTAAQQILEILESLPINTPDEPRALILWTDEMAHDASKASSIVEEAKAKGYEVIFAMSNDATKEVAVLPAEEISRAYELNKDNLRPGQKMYVGIADFSYGESASNDAYKVILKQADSGNPVLASTN